MKISSNLLCSRSASALLSTMLVITVLTIIVVAFLQSMTVERRTAHSYLNHYKADLAAKAALNTFNAAILEASKTGSFVVANRGNYCYAGALTGSTQEIAFFPLFTAAATSAANLKPADPAKTTPNLVPTAPTVAITDVGPLKATVDVSWIAIPPDPSAPAGADTQRFAYWAEDLSGYVDADTAGNIRNASHDGQLRDTGTNTDEIALYSVFQPNAPADPKDPAAKAIIEKRNSLFTTQTEAQIITDPSKSETAIRQTVARLPFISDIATIPGGFGYPDEGKPKYNLNYYVNAPDAPALATAISANLPQFATIRKGGLPSTDDYVKTLAASMVDYADKDSTPTVGGDYRGIDSTPFVTIFYDRFDFYKGQGSSTLTIHLTTYLQVWNLSDQSTNGQVTPSASGNFTFKANRSYTVNNTKVFADVAKNTATLPLTLKPNEVKVIKINEQDFTFDAGGTFVGTSIVITPGNDDTIETKWNGSVVDRTPGKIERQNYTLKYSTSRTEPKWSGGLPSLRHDPVNYNSYIDLQKQFYGDPRTTYYLDSLVSVSSYENRTSWWGMAVMRPSASHYLTDPSRWPDAAANNFLANPVYSASNEISLSTDPTTMGPSAGQPRQKEAPSHISNSGTYLSSTEIGNIYDPAMWSYKKTETSANVGASYKAVTFIPDGSNNTVKATKGNGLPSSPGHNEGGGITLRIGREEHPLFNVDGGHAYQLLDLLEVDSDNTSKTVKAAPINGRININTASEPVLTALIAGIETSADQSVTTPIPLPKNETPTGKFFSSAILANRSLGNFLCTSAQLSNFKDPMSKKNIFGDLEIWPLAERPIATLRDQAREELFSKIYNLTTTNSRFFRVFAVGQVLDVTATPVSTSRRVFYVAIVPTRDTAGAITSQTPYIFYENAF